MSEHHQELAARRHRVLFAEVGSGRRVRLLVAAIGPRFCFGAKRGHGKKHPARVKNKPSGGVQELPRKGVRLDGCRRRGGIS